MPAAFGDIDAIVAALHPRHTATRTAVAAESDTPARMRELWQALGTSEATAALKPSFLTREASRSEIDQVFSDWQADPTSRSRWQADGGAQAFWRHLPARVRLVWKTQKEIAVTDESGTADDPPVLVMKRAEPPIIKWHGSYVEWLVWELLRTLTITRSAPYNRHCGMPGIPVKGGVLPKLAALADGIWWMEVPYSRPDSKPAVPRPIFYRSIRDYFAFLLALPDDKLPYFSRPAAASFVVRPRGALNIEKKPPEGFRVFTPRGLQDELLQFTRAAVGLAGETPVWLATAVRGTEASVYFNPKDEAAVRAWLADLEAKIVEEDPLRENYDRFGW